MYGEAARFVARAQVDIGTVHDAAERVGQPTTVLPGGVDVSSIQSLPVGTRSLCAHLYHFLFTITASYCAKV